MSKLFVVGLGPGEASQLTGAARAALEQADLLCGYTTYIELARAVCPDTPTLSTPMTKEIQRCRMALDAASKGQTVAMVCSGDAGVYGMAGPILQLAPEYPGVDIGVIPGVTAALSGAAVLGAPLANDFCVISLSDLLTPWPVIERRLDAAAKGDFSICLYNPASRRRTGHLRRACDILLKTRRPDTVCGWVKNIGREGQQSRVLTLAQLREETLDMFTTVFIGSDTTQVIDGRMVTPRGYEAKQ